MDPQQRQWMAQEIARWRKNRLLPAAYCNFLAQLYDVPLDAQEEGSNETVRSWADRIASLRPTTWMVVFIIFVLFCIIGFHFTAFAAPMQISVIAAPALVLAALAWSGRKDESAEVPRPGADGLPDSIRRRLACAAGPGMDSLVAAERGLARCLRAPLAAVRHAGAFRTDAGSGLAACRGRLRLHPPDRDAGSDPRREPMAVAAGERLVRLDGMDGSPPVSAGRGRPSYRLRRTLVHAGGGLAGGSLMESAGSGTRTALLPVGKMDHLMV